MHSENNDPFYSALKTNDALIIGLDVSGDPRSTEENDVIEGEIRKAKQNGLKVAAHIGETVGSLATAPGLLALTDRIGHGTFLAFDDLQSKLPFELCPTSNLISKTVASYEKHHFGELYQRKWPLCICTDDKGVFNTTLSNEYYQLAVAFNLSRDELKELSKNVIEFVFDASVKERLTKMMA